MSNDKNRFKLRNDSKIGRDIAVDYTIIHTCNVNGKKYTIK